MIDLTSEYVKGFLRHIKQRVALTSETLSWIEGEPVLDPVELVPPFTPRSEAAAAFDRYAKQVQSLGPRALKIRRQGAVGTVTWSKVPTEVDRAIDALPLRRLARDCAKDVLANGITAIWPVIPLRPDGPGAPVLQRLTGHLEILWSEDDVGGQPVGLLQVTGNASTHQGNGIRYDVRIYDYVDGVLRIWRDLASPGYLAEDPDETWPQEGGQTLVMPAVATTDLTQDGYPIGELKQGLPLLKQEVAEAIRVLRVSDGHAYPMWALAGPWEEPKRLGTNVYLRSKETGSVAQRIDPPSLDPLFDEVDRTQDRIRTDLMLPITTGGQIPSGEALIQANAGYNGASDDLARTLGGVITDAVRAYAPLVDLALPDTFVVTVKPDRELKRMTIAMQVREDYRAGIVNRRIALGELEQFYPNMSTEDLDDWLAEADDPLPSGTSQPPGAFGSDDEA